MNILGIGFVSAVAKLTAVVDETFPEAGVHGVNLDYSPLVTETFPMIPEPESLDIYREKYRRSK